MAEPPGLPQSNQLDLRSPQQKQDRHQWLLERLTKANDLDIFHEILDHIPTIVLKFKTLQTFRTETGYVSLLKHRDSRLHTNRGLLLPLSRVIPILHGAFMFFNPLQAEVTLRNALKPGDPSLEKTTRYFLRDSSNGNISSLLAGHSPGCAGCMGSIHRFFRQPRSNLRFCVMCARDVLEYTHLTIQEAEDLCLIVHKDWIDRHHRHTINLTEFTNHIYLDYELIALHIHGVDIAGVREYIQAHRVAKVKRNAIRCLTAKALATIGAKLVFQLEEVRQCVLDCHGSGIDVYKLLLRLPDGIAERRRELITSHVIFEYLTALMESANERMLINITINSLCLDLEKVREQFEPEIFTTAWMLEDMTRNMAPWIQIRARNIAAVLPASALSPLRWPEFFGADQVELRILVTAYIRQLEHQCRHHSWMQWWYFVKHEGKYPGFPFSTQLENFALSDPQQINADSIDFFAYKQVVESDQLFTWENKILMMLHIAAIRRIRASLRTLAFHRQASIVLDDHKVIFRVPGGLGTTEEWIETAGQHPHVSILYGQGRFPSHLGDYEAVGVANDQGMAVYKRSGCGALRSLGLCF